MTIENEGEEEEAASHNHEQRSDIGSASTSESGIILTANGAAVGGYQAILFTPDPKEPKPNPSPASQQPVNGAYRAGTDHRKDGQAAAW